MARKLENTLEDLDLTQDEIQRFTKAFKDEEFRKLFREYAEEINDPENRKKYEQEIAMMEAERGMDVEFVHPKPGYVIKTTIDGNAKAFINIATNEHVGKPSHKRATEQGKSGLVWSIPHLFSHPREDLDKSNKECRVFDVVFHPDTYRMAESNARFRKLVEDTALDGIENQFSVKVDKRNFRRPKMKYKGQPVATVIRKHKEGQADSPNADGDGAKSEKSVLDSFPYPYENKSSEELSAEMRASANEKKQLNKDTQGKEDTDDNPTHTVPTYVLKYSQDVQLDDFGTFGQPRNELQARSRQPDRVIVEIDLPLIKAAGSLDLDISERSLTVTSEKPAAYKLTVPFSYYVQEEGGNAKFDKKTRKLVVTLPIVPRKDVSMDVPLSITNFAEAADKVQDRHEESMEPPKLVEEIQSCESTHEETRDEKEMENEVIDTNEEDCEAPNEKNENDPYVVEVVPVFEPQVKASDFNQRLPECTCREDDRCLSLLFGVKNVKLQNLRMCRDNSTCFQVLCTSYGGGGWPIDYLFFIKIEYQDQKSEFPFHNRPYNLDATSDNFIIQFGKLTEFQSRRAVGVYISLDNEHWSSVMSFEGGRKTKCLLKQNLNELFGKVSMSIIPEGENMQQYVNVSELSENVVTIHLDSDDDDEQPATVEFHNLELEGARATTEDKGKETEDGNDCNSDNHPIEVVFKTPPRALHSILKKTSSQSSESQLGEIRGDEELCCSCSGHASADDIRSLHKSVSFSGRPEVTNYSVAQPVCSLHNTLKNRRRKNKRREQRRRITSGSRSTEEDEEVVAACMSDKYCNNMGKIGRGEPRQRHYSDSILVTEGHGFIEPDDFVLQDSNENINLDAAGTSKDSSQNIGQTETVAPFETKRRKRKKKKEQHTDKNANVSKETNSDHESPQTSQESENEPKRTSVNWSDDVVPHPNDEHRTTCAVDFVNSTIFELDDD